MIWRDCTIFFSDEQDTKKRKEEEVEMEKRLMVARKLLALAREIESQDEEEEDVVDEAFAAKVRTIKTKMSQLARMKNRRLKQFGIGILRPSSRVEELVDALIKILPAA